MHYSLPLIMAEKTCIIIYIDIKCKQQLSLYNNHQHAIAQDLSMQANQTEVLTKKTTLLLKN